jgi:hypothetical protein
VLALGVIEAMWRATSLTGTDPAGAFTPLGRTTRSASATSYNARTSPPRAVTAAATAAGDIEWSTTESSVVVGPDAVTAIGAGSATARLSADATTAAPTNLRRRRAEGRPRGALPRTPVVLVLVVPCVLAITASSQTSPVVYRSRPSPDLTPDPFGLAPRALLARSERFSR